MNNNADRAIEKTQELNLRPANINDIPAIRSLALQIWPEAYKAILSADQLTYMLELFYSEAALREQFDRHWFVMASLQEKPAGFASYAATEDPLTFKLHKLYVLSSVQGKGLGKALLDYVVNAIRSNGGLSLQLNVNRHNKAKLFYEKSGFRILREEDIPIGDDYFMNDYVMGKSI